LGCSLSGPSERTFAPAVLNDEAKSTGSEAASKKLEADRATCKSEARQRGIRSVLAIIRSADRSNTDKDYIDCMKGKGYKVEEGPETSTGKAPPGTNQVPAAKQ
jgi:hypothetical protein